MHAAGSTSLNEHKLCRALRSRAEPGGRTIVYNRAREQYLFANEQALQLIDELRAGGTLSEQCRVVAERNRVPELVAATSIVRTLLALAGQIVASESPDDTGNLPAVWTLAGELGPALERCETFGMPL